MIDTRETGTRATLLVAATSVGLGVLAAANLRFVLRVPVSGLVGDDLTFYTPLVVLVLALLAWHLSPRRSWSALVVLGSLCTIPNLLLTLAPDSYTPWMRYPFVIVDTASRPLLLVGLLCAATMVWQAGRRNVGAGLLGAVVVVPVLATFLVASVVYGVAAFVPVLGLVFAVATIVLTVMAAMSGPGEPEPRPEWRMTLAGAIAALAPLVFRYWRGPERTTFDIDEYREQDAFFEEIAQHAMIVGVVVLAVGLLAGAFAGLRVLAAGAASGLLLGAVTTLAGPALMDIHDLPAAVPAVIALLALAAGIVVALSRARTMVGITGLGVLIIGLLLLYLAFSGDDPSFDTDVLTPILIVVTTIAAVAVLASLGTVVAAAGEAPATFAAVAVAVAAGVSSIMPYFAYLADDDQPSIVSIYPPVMVVVAIAGAVTLFALKRTREVS